MTRGQPFEKRRHIYSIKSGRSEGDRRIYEVEITGEYSRNFAASISSELSNCEHSVTPRDGEGSTLLVANSTSRARRTCWLFLCTPEGSNRPIGELLPEHEILQNKIPTATEEAK
jgi:hypothetical protein